MPLALHPPHAWDLTPQQAIDLQRDLSRQVKITPLPADITRIAGVDVGFHEGVGRAAVVVLDYPSLTVTEHAVVETKVEFPYIPGLLSFRELPALLAAIEKLTCLPDVFVVDGHGYAHPRRFGIAAHLGVILDLPSLGCAKSVLVGRYGQLGNEAGDKTELCLEQEVIGMAVRTRQGCKPVFVSIGHRVDLESAIRLILACTRAYRLPEPTRLAHRLASDKLEHPQSPI
jgi:deoxyribonuclease V